MKTCLACKKEFISHSNSHKYCSQRCKKVWQYPNRRISLKKYEQSSLGIYKQLKSHAKQRYLRFNLSQRDFISWYNSQQRKCSYCNITEDQIKTFRFPRLTIDRKDNNKDYNLNNIVLSCHRCNTIKNKYLTYEEMLEVGKIIKRRK